MRWPLVPALLAIAAIVIGIAAIVLLVRRQYRRALLAGCLALLLAAIAGPGPVPASPKAKKNACIHYLSRIDEAKKGWANSHVLTNGLAPSWEDLIESDALLRVRPECPDGGVYSINMIGELPTCSRSDLGHALPNPKPGRSQY